MIVVSWICLLASPVFGAARTGIAGGIPTSPEDGLRSRNGLGVARTGIAGGIPTSPEDGLWSKEGLRSKEGRPRAAPGDGR
jgi:hypothetical protein